MNEAKDRVQRTAAEITRGESLKLAIEFHKGNPKANELDIIRSAIKFDKYTNSGSIKEVV